MSVKHPVIAVTGASGAGTSSVQQAFKEIFFRQSIHAAFVEGDGFLRSCLTEEPELANSVSDNAQDIRHYGPESNDFDSLEACFKQYGETGTTRIRLRDEPSMVNQSPQHFSDWQDITADTDCLFYEGMHGGVVAETWTRRKEDCETAFMNDRRKPSNQGVDVAQYVDLLIGVAPAINLEWIQRIHNGRKHKQHSAGEETQAILSQLQDYIHFIVPQFSLADVNFQRMPVVDTSNPFENQRVPTEKESIFVVSFRHPERFDVLSYVQRIAGASISGRDCMIIPGGQMQHALDIICAPLIEALIQRP